MKISKTQAAVAELIPSFSPASDERPVDATRARAIVSDPPMSSPTFNRGVRDGWLPQPVYVGPKMPRWWPSELRAAINNRRMSPQQAKEGRRQARLTREREQREQRDQHADGDPLREGRP